MEIAQPRVFCCSIFQGQSAKTTSRTVQTLGVFLFQGLQQTENSLLNSQVHVTPLRYPIEKMKSTLLRKCIATISFKGMLLSHSCNTRSN